MKTTYARIVIEHYNKTKPDLLRRLEKDYLSSLKEIQVEMALSLAKRYKVVNGLNDWEIRELIYDYLAPAEELPTENVNEISERGLIGK
ncbi:MAG: hypothetical protein RBQ97_08630 [Acholeplasma sp.]|nr:hypothetical protein [Acholeplasma sp.]